MIIPPGEQEEEFASIIASINPLHLQELALTTRRNIFPNLAADLSCIASTPPGVGSFNIVYKLTFSDGIKWVIRIPALFSPACSRTFYLDIMSQRLISSKTSIPLLQIHYWSLDASNLLSRPFVIMDFMPGMNLSKVWNDNNWITDVKRKGIFKQVAGWMIELSALEFEQISCLDWDDASGQYHVVPFPDASTLFMGIKFEEKDGVVNAGPFDTAHSFLSFLLSARRHIDDLPMLAVLQLFLITHSMVLVSYCSTPISTLRTCLSVRMALSQESLTGIMYTPVPARVPQRHILHGLW
jgi:hypothetical protein